VNLTLLYYTDYEFDDTNLKKKLKISLVMLQKRIRRLEMQMLVALENKSKRLALAK
jgi:hypothetical protein